MSTGQTLRQARLQRGLTQQQAAARLRISQPYLALLERDKRPLLAPLARKAMRVFELTATIVPCGEQRSRPATTDSLVRDLGALGYPGFAYVRGSRVRNPAEVLMEALEQPELDARVVEALPWLLLRYPEMDRDWLVRGSRLRNLTNRLGFVVSLAMRVQEKQSNAVTRGGLADFERELSHGRLEADTTLGKPVSSVAQQEWIRQNRSAEAARWHVLSTLRPEHLQYV